MKPLYAARIEDLGPRDFVKVEYIAYGHTELLSADMLRLSGCPLPPYTAILDLDLSCAAASATRRGRRSCRLSGVWVSSGRRTLRGGSGNE
jgi:hypothetical protein